MKAELIAIGSELLIGHTINTNAAYLSEELNAIGISVYYHTTVGDNPERIKDVLKLASSRSDLIITTGGLGPTADDITNETVAEFLNLKLIEDEEQRKTIIKKFAGRDIPDINYKQALRPKEAKVISNPIGTAMGLILEINSDHPPVTIMTLPGVPCEMEAMLQETIKPYLIDKLKTKDEYGAIVSKKIKFTGITESKMAEMINKSSDEINLFDSVNPSVAPYADLGQCYLRITAYADSEHKARNLMQPAQTQIENVLGEYIFGYDEDTIPSALAKKLVSKGLSIAFAESCTGGLLSKLMTDLPGASAYTKLNLVTYSNDMKTKMLKVNPETLEKYGAVSKETAAEMLIGLADISKADINVSVTGIAGPDGATEEKPIGTIFIGIKWQDQLIVEKLDWHARTLTREQVRELAAKKILFRVIKLIT